MARNRWDGFSGFDCDLTEERLRRRRPVPRPKPKPKPTAKPKPPPIVVHTDEALAEKGEEAVTGEATPAAATTPPASEDAPRRYGLVRLAPSAPPADPPTDD